MVSVAVFAACVGRRHIGCNGPYMEHDDRGATALAGDTITGDIDSVVTASERILDDTRVPDKRSDDPQLPIYGEGSGDSGCSRLSGAMECVGTSGRCRVHRGRG